MSKISNNKKSLKERIYQYFTENAQYFAYLSCALSGNVYILPRK